MAKSKKMAKSTVVATLPVWRFQLMALLLLILAGLLVWRALSLQVLDSGRGYQFLQGQGNARTIRSEAIAAHRGMITDRHGQPLAVSTPVASIWANPQELLEARDQWSQLASALGMKRAQLAERLQQYAKHQFVYLKRQLPPADAEKILALKIPGVYRQREYRRFYPAGEVTAHILGFTDIDDRGQEGLELAYDEWLRGEPGSKRVLKDLHGNIIRELDERRPARAGKDLQLSIDLRLQYLAYRELKAALQRSGAKAGSVVMLDSRSGEVLAMVNQPAFNPNNRNDMNIAALRNRAVTDMFEPGSTVKPFTVVAALESGKYTPTSTIDTNPGYIWVEGKTLLDHRNYGVLDITHILQKSSQVGTTKLALSLDEQAVWNVFQRVGLGRSTGTGFPGENNGMLPNRPQWRAIERATFAFGYGLTVTSLQLAQAYSVLANDGVMQPVTLLHQQSEKSHRVLDAKVARQVVRMLETVTEPGGTGTRARVKAYRVAGKTGTVHKVGSEGYDHDRYRALFAGMAPVSNPQVVTVVTIDEPGHGRYYGGEVAAPVFAKVTADAMRLLSVAPDSPDDEAVAESKPKLHPNSA